MPETTQAKKPGASPNPPPAPPAPELNPDNHGLDAVEAAILAAEAKTEKPVVVRELPGGEQQVIETQEVAPGRNYALDSKRCAFTPIGNGFFKSEDGNNIFHLESAPGRVARNVRWVKIDREMEAFFRGVVHARFGIMSEFSKTLTSTVGSTAGYLVPAAFRTAIFEYSAPGPGVWPRAQVWNIPGDTLSLPALVQDPREATMDFFGSVVFTWPEEGGYKDETEPEFRQIQFRVREMSGYTAVTNHLLKATPINLANYITTLFQAAFLWSSDRVFLRGSGAGQPLGIIMDPGVVIVPRITAGTVTAQDILNMEEALSSVFDTGAVWFYSKKARAALRKNPTGAGNTKVLYEQYKDFAAPYIAELLGFPAVLMDGKVMPIGTKGDVILGNWAYYAAVLQEQFAVQMSEHYQFRRNLTSFRAQAWLDGRALEPKAFVVLGDAQGGS